MKTMPAPAPLPPPTVTPAPAPRQGHWSRLPRWLQVWLVACVAIVVAVSGIVYKATRNDEPARQLSPTQAACQLLEDGDSPQRAYDVMRDLLADESYAVGDDTAAVARRAVDRAVAQGC